MVHERILHHPFSPWLARPEQLARTLIGRDEQLGDILGKILTVGEGAGPKHLLMVGPRGMGKTHLLCLIHHYTSGSIEPKPGLPGPISGWISVLFVEEAYPESDSLANFLLSLMRKLIEVSPEEELWRLPEDIAAQPDPIVCDCCFERIREFSRQRGKKLLILVDNIQKIFEQFPVEDHHSLRAFLTDQDSVLFVVTAPRLFKMVVNYNAPFFEFFETVFISDLSREEMFLMIKSRFREDGREDEFKAREESLRRKIPAIRKLTGGNPRLILFLYDIITRSTFIDVEVALRSLIEELSDYFRNRYDTLATQPRKVLDAFARMEGPATPSEIAIAARLKIQTVNAQIRRLKKWGYLEPIKLERKRLTRYDVTERLFRIWRQTATVAGKRRFSFLAEFLKIYYTPEELKEMNKLKRSSEALSFIDKAIRINPEDSSSYIEKARTLSELDRYEEAVSALDEAQRHNASDRDLFNAKSEILMLNGRFSEAIEALETGLKTAPDDWNMSISREIARACMGEHGPGMEGLPDAILGQGFPADEPPSIFLFLLDLSLAFFTRGEDKPAVSLFTAALSIIEWQKEGWLGRELGLFLGRLLDRQPESFHAAVEKIRERVVEKDVIELLNPYIQASDYVLTRDPSILERLFPEVREIVLEIAERFNLLKKTRIFLP